MDNQTKFSFFDELDDTDQSDTLVDLSRRKKRLPPRTQKRIAVSDKDFIRGQDDSSTSFKFTYPAARFEEWWLLDSLGDFYEHQWISDVLRKVKGGKEASVYLCTPGVAVPSELIAAKVYRPRSLRNLKNDHVYRAGRSDLDDDGKPILDEGKLHAMKKKTSYGKELLHQSWIAYEISSLEKLYKSGVSVPQPFTMAHNAILMSFVGDMDGSAPALSEVALDRQDVKKLFEIAVKNIGTMLSCGMIHGDLSAYNILYWEGELFFIDFPQVVSPKDNKNAYSIFLRDVTRVCEYFVRQGLKTDSKKIAKEIWTSYKYPLLQDVDVRLLDTDDPLGG